MRRSVLLASLLAPVLLLAGGGAGAAVDRTEVSNAEYAAFLERHPQHRRPKYWDEYRPAYFVRSPAARLAPFDATTFTRPDHPVVGVSLHDADDYCRWRGARLPTRAEWMHAAGGDDGRIWPWGDHWDYARANSGGERHGEHDGHTYAAPVTAFTAGSSPTGQLNMAGNVAEWVAEGLVVGGSSNSSPSGVAITGAVAREAEYRSFDIGFRCIAP